MRSLIALYDALITVGVPRDKARSVVDAMERCMVAPLTLPASQMLVATPIQPAPQIRHVTPPLQSDRLSPNLNLTREVEQLRHENARLRLRIALDTMTLRFGCIVAVSCTLFYLAIKLI